MNNIRPVSLTHIVGKVLEKIVNKYLVQYLEENNFLSPSQLGFRKGCSTTDCILKLLYHVSTALDSGLYTTCIFFDYKKAFDSVDHVMLLEKLRCYGISHVGLKWFESYCNGRVQHVKVDGRFSNKLSISTGVPQGSILGPTLFSLYVSDVVNLHSNGYLIRTLI